MTKGPEVRARPEIEPKTPASSSVGGVQTQGVRAGGQSSEWVIGCCQPLEQVLIERLLYADGVHSATSQPSDSAGGQSHHDPHFTLEKTKAQTRQGPRFDTASQWLSGDLNRAGPVLPSFAPHDDLMC